MLIDESPIDVNEANGPSETTPAADAPALGEAPRAAAPASVAIRGSRWVDYDTHELLQLISDLEDERRWARFREGVWIAILIHAALFAAVLLLPKYVFKAPVVVDSSQEIEQHKEFTYMDTPKWEPKVEVKPVPVKPPQIDKKTLEELNKAAPPPPEPEPAPQAVAPPPTPPSQQSQVEAPRPAAVPARPNFAMNSQNPADALRDAMKGASRSPGFGDGNQPSNSGLRMHPGAGTGGIEVLSDTQGVDFNGWLQRWHRETERTWDPLIPDEVNPPILKSGMVAIRFKVLPNGRLMDGSLVLEGRSGDVALDRAAWGALTGSNYPPLPRDFHGPYLELRAFFLYNMEPQR
jgi:outer membrane biosynthesis protein TonB